MRAKTKTLSTLSDFFNEIAGEKFEGFVLSGEVPNHSIEDEGERDPDDGPGDGFPETNGVRFAVKDPEINREHREDEEVESDPKPG